MWSFCFQFKCQLNLRCLGTLNTPARLCVFGAFVCHDDCALSITNLKLHLHAQTDCLLKIWPNRSQTLAWIWLVNFNFFIMTYCRFWNGFHLLLCIHPPLPKPLLLAVCRVPYRATLPCLSWLRQPSKSIQLDPSPLRPAHAKLHKMLSQTDCVPAVLLTCSLARMLPGICQTSSSQIICVSTSASAFNCCSSAGFSWTLTSVM